MAGQEAGGLRAGFAEMDITPPTRCPIAGYFAPRRNEGVLDPLFARAAVLDSGGERIALVGCDLLSVRRRTVVHAREAIEAATGIPGDHVAIFATHTHTGPYTSTIFGEPPDEKYLKTLQASICETVQNAAACLEPMELGVGCAFESTLAFNRRWVMKDGRVRTHPQRASVELAYPEGPMDPEVGVLCFRRPGDRVAGFLVNFACHTNVVGGCRISADYPGALSRELKRVYGAGCITLFGNGACGNISQLDICSADKDDSGPQWAAVMGKVLAQDVEEACRTMVFVSDVRLDAAARPIALGIRDPDATPYHGTMFASAPPPEIDAIYEAEQQAVRQMVLEAPRADVELQVLRVGPAALAMIPAEFFVEFGLEIKLRSPIKPTFVIELANGVVGYVPTEQAFERGGYEVRTATTSKLVPEAGRQIVAAVLDGLAELAGR